MQQSQHALLLNQYDEVISELELDEHGYWHLPKECHRMMFLLGDEFRIVGYNDMVPAEQSAEAAMA